MSAQDGHNPEQSGFVPPDGAEAYPPLGEPAPGSAQPMPGGQSGYPPPAGPAYPQGGYPQGGYPQGGYPPPQQYPAQPQNTPAQGFPPPSAAGAPGPNSWPAGQPDHPVPAGYPPAPGAQGGPYGMGPQTPSGPAQPAFGAPGPGYGEQRRPANLFAGVRPGDFARLGLGVLLLLLSLAFKWDGQYRDAERLEVLLITLLSVISAGGFVLGRMRVLPAGALTVNFRLLCNIPYFVMVVVYLIGAFVTSFTVVDTFPGGVGPALSIGLTGALLVAQPLECEIRDIPPGSWTDRIWRILAAVPVGVVVLGGLLALVGMAIAEHKPSGIINVWSAVQVLGAVAAIVLAGIGILRRDQRWLMTVMCIGAAALVLVPVVSGSDLAALPTGMINFGVGTAFSASHYVLFAWYMWPVLGAIAAAAGARREMKPAPEDLVWWGAIRSTLLVTIVIGATQTVGQVLVLTQAEAFGLTTTGAAAMQLIAGLVAVAAGVAGLLLIGRGNPRMRIVVFAAAGAMFLFGLIAGIAGKFGPLEFMIAFGIPLVLVGQVLLPAPMRGWLHRQGGASTAAGSQPVMPGSSPMTSPGYGPPPGQPSAQPSGYGSPQVPEPGQPANGAGYPGQPGFPQEPVQGQPAWSQPPDPQAQPAWSGQPQAQEQPAFQQPDPQGQPVFQQPVESGHPEGYSSPDPQGQPAWSGQPQDQGQPVWSQQPEPQGQPAWSQSPDPQAQPVWSGQPQAQGQPAFEQPDPQGQPVWSGQPEGYSSPGQQGQPDFPQQPPSQPQSGEPESSWAQPDYSPQAQPAAQPNWPSVADAPTIKANQLPAHYAQPAVSAHEQAAEPPAGPLDQGSRQSHSAEPMPAESAPTEQFSLDSGPAEQVIAEPVGSHAVADSAAGEAPPEPPAFTAEQAANPGTAAATLAKIVETRPDLRKYVAANPNTYQALLDWLAGLRDPEVDAALARRNT